jgi:hypothetical protein
VCVSIQCSWFATLPVSISLGSPSLLILPNFLVIFIACVVAVGDPRNLLRKCEDRLNGSLLNFVHNVTGGSQITDIALCVDPT